MTIDVRAIVETIVGLVLSGVVALAINSINAKVENKFLQLQNIVNSNYVTHQANEKLCERFENMLGKLDAQLSEKMSKLDAQLTERMNAGFAALRNWLPPYNDHRH